MKNRFLISEEEKNRILNMHLKEQTSSILPGDTPTSQNPFGGKFPNPLGGQLDYSEGAKKLMDDGVKWVNDNSNILKYGVDDVIAILNDKVKMGDISNEILPFIKSSIELLSQNKIKFPPVGTGDKSPLPEINQELMKMAQEWIKNNSGIMENNPEGINKLLSDLVLKGAIKPELVPIIKGTIQTMSNGKITFKPEDVAPQIIQTIQTIQQQMGGTQTSQPIVLGVKNPKVEQIQTKLNEKYKAGLVVDGKWGPKTADAVAKFLGDLKSQEPKSVTPTNTTPTNPSPDSTLV